MTPLGATLAHTLSVLDRLGARSALIGGLAVSIWTQPRAVAAVLGHLAHLECTSHSADAVRGQHTVCEVAAPCAR